MKPKISIIIPVYNVEQYIERCLESVRNQSIRDIEIIIVNDGTKDKSIEVISKYIYEDKRIKLIEKETGGLMSAWKAGVKVATADYIGFVDSDDWVDITYYETLYEKAIMHEADVVVGKYLSEYENKSIDCIQRNGDKEYCGAEIISDYLLTIISKENIITYCRWDKLYKRNILINNMDLFLEDISLGEDVNTNVAVLPDAKKVLVLEKAPYYHYRINKNSIAHTFNPNQNQNILLLYNQLLKIASVKHFDKYPVFVFIGDMIYQQIRTCLSIRSIDRRTLFFTTINSFPNVEKLLREYSKYKRIGAKIFIYFAIKRKYGVCLVINYIYNYIMRREDVERCDFCSTGL